MTMVYVSHEIRCSNCGGEGTSFGGRSDLPYEHGDTRCCMCGGTGDEQVELAVTLDMYGEIANVAELVMPVGGEGHIQPLTDELRDRLDWPQLAEDALATLNARLRGWP